MTLLTSLTSKHRERNAFYRQIIQKQISKRDVEFCCEIIQLA